MPETLAESRDGDIARYKRLTFLVVGTGLLMGIGLLIAALGAVGSRADPNATQQFPSELVGRWGVEPVRKMSAPFQIAFEADRTGTLFACCDSAVQFSWSVENGLLTFAEKPSTGDVQTTVQVDGATSLENLMMNIRVITGDELLLEDLRQDGRAGSSAPWRLRRWPSDAAFPFRPVR